MWRPHSNLPEVATEKPERDSDRNCSGRRRSNGYRLKKGKLRLDIWKKFFTVRVVRHWHRLSREVVDALSLEMLKARLDGAWNNLG